MHCGATLESHKSLHHATLFPSSSTTVSHCHHAWFFSVIGLFLLPLVFAEVCFSIFCALASLFLGIPGDFVHVVLKSVGASNVSLITVWIYGYMALFMLLFSKSYSVAKSIANDAWKAIIGHPISFPLRGFSHCHGSAIDMIIGPTSDSTNCNKLRSEEHSLCLFKEHRASQFRFVSGSFLLSAQF